MLFWLFARNVLMLPGLAAVASCSAPSRPPGDSEAAIDCCASFSQLVPVADAMLIEAIAMDAGPDFVCLHSKAAALTNPEPLTRA